MAHKEISNILWIRIIFLSLLHTYKRCQVSTHPQGQIKVIFWKIILFASLVSPSLILTKFLNNFVEIIWMYSEFYNPYKYKTLPEFVSSYLLESNS